MCVLQKGTLFFCLSGSSRGDLNFYDLSYQQFWKEWAFSVPKRVFQTMPFLSLNWQISWFTCLRLVWLGTELVYIILLFQPLEPHHHKVSNHHIISKLMPFLLQHPPSCNQFDPWDIKCYIHCYSKMIF